MRAKFSALTCTGLVLVVLPLSIGSSLAGPCSDDIAALGRKLSASPGLGPATTGALAGSGPGTIKSSASQAAPDPAGTSADKSVGGTAGTKEMNAASAQVATSADDVRRQQQGLPTAAQAASQGATNSVETTPRQNVAEKPDDRISEAKTELEKARALDQQNDRMCADAVNRAQSLSGG